MQRQGAFAFLHQSAKHGRMVNLHEKTSKIGVICEIGQIEPRIARITRMEEKSLVFFHPCDPCNPWFIVCAALLATRCIVRYNASRRYPIPRAKERLP
jgi:hypothetical protein